MSSNKQVLAEIAELRALILRALPMLASKPPVGDEDDASVRRAVARASADKDTLRRNGGRWPSAARHAGKCSKGK